MLAVIQPETADPVRAIAHRTRGRRHGPITRLASPGDLGELMKPFVFLDLFQMDGSKGTGFGYHPHSGIATVTTVFEGDTNYEDSTGATGLLKARGVEWMQAGDGVWHTGSPAAAGPARGYQLWLALPEALENAPAASEYLSPEQVPSAGPARVILGTYDGVASPLPQIAPLTYLHVHLNTDEEWTFDPPEGHDIAWIASDGAPLEISGATLSNELAIFEEGSGALRFRALGSVDVMVGSAQKHPHPLVTGHYSVHTSPAALQIGEAGIRRVGALLEAAGKI